MPFIIEKKVIELFRTGKDPFDLDGFDDNTFEVPIDAEMVEIGWSSLDPDGIALWYRTRVPESPEEGEKVKFWKLFVKHTYEQFSDDAKHVCTVTRPGIELHVFDATGDVVWAEL